MTTIFVGPRALSHMVNHFEPSTPIGPSDLDVLPGNVQAIEMQYSALTSQFVICEDSPGRSWFLYSHPLICRTAPDIVARIRAGLKLGDWLTDKDWKD